MKEKEHGVRVVESSTRLVDIPYGDYFSVEDRWTIVPHSAKANFCEVYIDLKVRVRYLPANSSDMKCTDSDVLLFVPGGLR